MGVSDHNERYCDYERSYFPNDQFEVDPEWGLVHEVEPRHTIRGTEIARLSNGEEAEEE